MDNNTIAKSKFVITASPHVKDTMSTRKIMITVIIALMPALAASVFWFGISAITLTAVCILSSVLFEYLYKMVTKQESTISDCSAVLTGLLLAMNLPPHLPVWMAVFGSFVAIVLVKQLFGGIGQNFANPAATARVIMLISFTSQMTSFVVPTKTANGIELVAGATPLGMMAEGKFADLPDALSMAIGMRGGSLGETCSIALLIGGFYLIYRKIISPAIPVAYIGSVFVFSWLLGADPIFAVLSGGLMIGAFFMATDYVSSPVTTKGKIIFGLGCGILTVGIRLFGSYPEGVSFAIVLMNILTPHIDTLTTTKPFGGTKK